MFHPDHNKFIQNKDNYVKPKIIFDVFGKSLYNLIFNSFLHISNNTGRSPEYETGFLERKSAV